MYFKVIFIATLLAMGGVCADANPPQHPSDSTDLIVELGANPIPPDTLELLLRYSANYWGVSYSEMEQMYQLGLLTITAHECDCEWLVINRGLDCLTILGADIGF